MNQGEQKKTEGELNVLDSILRHFIGSGLGFVICIAMLLAFSVFISNGVLDAAHLFQYAVAACILAVFAGTKLAKYFFGEITLPGGVLIGAVFFLLLLLAGYVGFSTMNVENGGLGLGISSLLGGALAGVSLPARKKKTKNRRK